jgi:hypothetical protein
LLAERVLRIQERVESGDYATAPLDENLIRMLHRDFCGDLVPEWAAQICLPCGRATRKIFNRWLGCGCNGWPPRCRNQAANKKGDSKNRLGVTAWLCG